MSTPFDQAQAARFEDLLRAAGIEPTIFPLTADRGIPAGKWGSLDPGEFVPNEDPLAGYGIATGRGLVCIDVDSKNGVDGFATLAKLEETHGPLPEQTLTVESPSGGVHLYLTHPGRFKSCAGELGEGLDVRAEGGYVRIPGSPHPTHSEDIYTVTEAVPPALLPPVWADHVLPRQGAHKGLEPVEADPLDADPAELRERLAALAKGRRGPVWAAWRKVVEGERFLRVRGGSVGPALSGDFGGVDDFLSRGMIAALVTEGEWYRVTPEAFVRLFGPSLSILQADDKRAGNPIYTDRDIADKWRRATEYARRRIAEREKNDALADRLREFTDEQEALPWIVVQAGAYYVRTPVEPIKYIGPVVRNSAWVTARDEWKGVGPDVYKPGKHGPTRMSVDDLAERYGRAVSEVAHSLHSTRPMLDEATRALILPGNPIRVEARHHPDIARWLATYDPNGRIHDWIAIVTDLEYAAPALWLTGAGGVGKSLLAAGLARLWAASPTPMSRAFADFNDSILACPLVEGEEEVPRGRDGRPDVEALKRLITETRRKINEKHKPIRDVVGAVRVLMSSNNTNLIRTAADLTAEDAQALADRFVHVHVAPERADEVKATLPTDGVIQREWIDGDRIAEHALHLVQTRTVPYGPRLRMAPDSERLRRMLLTQPGAGFLVCQAVYDWTVKASRSARKGQLPRDPGITWHQGCVCATASAILRKLPEDSKRHSRRSIGQTMRRFADSEQVTIRTDEGPRKYWRLDMENIRTWAESEGWGDVDELDAAAAILNRTEQNEGTDE